MKIENQIAIVTGSAKGIGAAIAKRYGSQGAKVVVADINGEGASATSDEINAAGGTSIAVRRMFQMKHQLMLCLKKRSPSMAPWTFL